MTHEPQDKPESATAVPRIGSRAEFHTALRWGFEAAIAEGSRRIVCCDRSFAEWPWDDAALLALLTAWLKRPQRRLVLLAAGYDEVPRRHPRFTAWRRDWVHAIDTWQASAERAPELPTLLVCEGRVSVQLADAVHWRGRGSLDGREARLWLEELDVVLQQCERGFAVHTLGL